MGIQIGDDIAEHILQCEARYWIAWVRTIKSEFRASRWQAQKKRLIDKRGEDYVKKLAWRMNEIKHGESK